MLPILVTCLEEKTQLSAKAISLQALTGTRALSLLILLVLSGKAVLAAEDIWCSQEGQSRSKTVGKEVTGWRKTGEVSGLNYLKTSSEWKECGQALWHNGKWAGAMLLCALFLLSVLTQHEQ